MMNTDLHASLPSPAPVSAARLGLFAAGLMTLAAPALAEETVLERLDWTTDLEHFQVDSDKFVGQRFSFECPELSARDALPAIHGTNVYPSTSPLCPAAVHAGVVGADGGRITVQLNPGLDAYAGRRKNGVASTPFAGTKRSMVFLGDAFAEGLTPVQREFAPRLKWSTKFTATGLANRKLVGQRFVFHCPSAPGKLPGRRVYGTDRYAFNSYVCLSAVHAGRLTAAGGYVFVQMVEADGRLEGSIRNGVESKSGPGGSRQLVFPVLPPELAALNRD